MEALNEFRMELQKPNALINADTLVACQGAFADRLLSLIEPKVLSDEEILKIYRTWDTLDCPDRKTAEAVAVERLRAISQAK